MRDVQLLETKEVKIILTIHRLEDEIRGGLVSVQVVGLGNRQRLPSRRGGRRDMHEGWEVEIRAKDVKDDVEVGVPGRYERGTPPIRPLLRWNATLSKDHALPARFPETCVRRARVVLLALTRADGRS